MGGFESKLRQSVIKRPIELISKREFKEFSSKISFCLSHLTLPKGCSLRLSLDR